MHPVIEMLNWASQGDRALALLRDLLRLDTCNPPGNTANAAELCASELRDAGVEPELLEAGLGHVNVVGRLPANSGAGESPLLLTAHLDTVPVEEHGWTHPPFAADIVDGYVWGRGAVDMKNHAAMCLTALRLLAEADAPRRRDVIFAGVADEEAGCDNGSAWLVAEHADKVRAGYALGEVGGFTLHVGGRAIYPVQVAEKGTCWIRATARGNTGHGSIPREDNAIVQLSRFVSRIGRTKMKVRRSAAVERFITALAETQSQPARSVLPLLLQPQLSPVVGRAIPDRSMARLLEALVRNTVSPVVVAGGSKSNVIPSEAEVDLDGRIAVGSTAQELLAELRAMAGDAITFEVLHTRTPHVASPDTDLFATIGDVVAEHHPGAVAVPSVIPGFTDAHFWSTLGTVCYGFSPVRLPEGAPPFAELFHATDERIPVDGFTAGTRMLADVVARFVLGP